MKLSTEDVELFYELMWSLQFFVKQKLKMFPKIRTIRQYANISQQDKVQVRKEMYINIELIDTYINENPQNFPDEHLAIVEGWKDYISDTFVIERMLKRYTVFISSKNDVYAVSALTDGFDQIVHKSHLPLYISAVLLPFKGKIIYDGIFFRKHNVQLGSGIKNDLKELYMVAKQNGKIIETLEPDIKPKIPAKTEKKAKDYTQELEKLMEISRKLQGGAGQQPVNSPIFSLIKASIELGQQAVSNSDNTEELWRGLKKVVQSVNKINRSLSRSEY